MNKVEKVLGIVGAFVVAVFLIVFIFLNQIKAEIITLVSVYGYIAIFLVALVVDMLAQPIGPEVPLAAGKLMGLNIGYVALITTLGSIIASIVNYRVGKIFHTRIYNDKKYAKYLKWYKKHGKYGLLISALGPVPYVPFCWFSGAFGLHITTFLYFGMFPRILRILLISGILSLVF